MTTDTHMPKLWVQYDAMHQQLQLQIGAIRITVYQFYDRYNGIFTGFWRFFTKIKSLIPNFSGNRAPFTKVELDFFKWRGGLQKTKGSYFGHIRKSSKFLEPPLFLRFAPLLFRSFTFLSQLSVCLCVSLVRCLTTTSNIIIKLKGLGTVLIFLLLSPIKNNAYSNAVHFK